MPNVTFSVPQVLYERMKKYPEIKWSTLYRQTIEQYLEKLENNTIITMKELREKLKKKGITMENLTHEQVIENYKKTRDLKWERTYLTPTD